jgi:hypothetical protein
MNNGGPAFPRRKNIGLIVNKSPESKLTTELSGDDYEPIYKDDPGMTLRDYFAAKAMAALMVSASYKHIKTPEQVAESAYKLADIMLAEREGEL